MNFLVYHHLRACLKHSIYQALQIWRDINYINYESVYEIKGGGFYGPLELGLGHLIHHLQIDKVD